MNLDAQKVFRFTIPGVLLYMAQNWFCERTGWCGVDWPSDLKDILLVIPVLLWAALYWVSKLGPASNAVFYECVNEKICSELIRPFVQNNPNFSNLDWKGLRIVYYYFIDRDESLRTKGLRIRFNGLLWTAIADVRAVSFVGGAVFSFATIISNYHWVAWLKPFEETRMGLPMAGFILAISLSIIFSVIVTRRHKKLCQEQIDYILFHYENELHEKLLKLTSSIS